MTGLLALALAICVLVGYLIGFQHGFHVATFPKAKPRDEDGGEGWLP